MADARGALIAKKIANALIPDAEAIDAFTLGVSALETASELGGSAPLVAPSAALEGIRKFYGGLWVGGDAYLYERTLDFVPNALNKALHKGDMSLRIALARVTRVHQRFGLVSGIIDIDASGGRISLRTYGAKQFAEQISQQAARARSAA